MWGDSCQIYQSIATVRLCMAKEIRLDNSSTEMVFIFPSMARRHWYILSTQLCLSLDIQTMGSRHDVDRPLTLQGSDNVLHIRGTMVTLSFLIDTRVCGRMVKLLYRLSWHTDIEVTHRESLTVTSYIDTITFMNNWEVFVPNVTRYIVHVIWKKINVYPIFMLVAAQLIMQTMELTL